MIEIIFSSSFGTMPIRADGAWYGDEASLAEEFDVPQEEVYSTLAELCDSRLIEQLGPTKFIVADWPEEGDSDEEECY